MDARPSMDDLRERVAQWHDRYNDTGTVPALAMLGVAALCFLLVIPFLNARAKDVFIKVVGTRLLVAALKCAKVTLHTQEAAFDSNTFVIYVTFFVDIVQWVLSKPAAWIFGEFASDICQISLFCAGVSFLLEVIQVPEAFSVIGRRDIGTLKFSNFKLLGLVLTTFIVMPIATYTAFVTYVIVKCLGICQAFRFIEWCNSTERTCKAPKAKAEKKKNDPVVFKLYKTTHPDRLWNMISEQEGMNYDEITEGCKNNQERVEALLPYVEKIFTVERVDTTSPSKKK